MYIPYSIWHQDDIQQQSYRPKDEIFRDKQQESLVWQQAENKAEMKFLLSSFTLTF